MSKRKVTFEIKNCLDCPYHEVQADPDRSDSFCSDDEKVVCKKKRRNIVVAERPYNLRKNCDIPAWCPLFNVLDEMARAAK